MTPCQPLGSRVSFSQQQQAPMQPVPFQQNQLQLPGQPMLSCPTPSACRPASTPRVVSSRKPS